MIKLKKRNRNLLVIAVIFVIIFIIIYLSIDSRANNLLASTADAVVKAKITGIANQSVINTFKTYPEMYNLVSVSTDETGTVSHVTANSVLMNDLSYKTSEILLDEISKLNSVEISINWSALLGSNLFSGMGPSVTILVTPIGNVSTSYISEFVSAGINQTRHRIYLEVVCDVSIVMPAGNHNTRITTPIIVSECIVVGKVPNSYVYVDETDKMLNLIPD